MESGNNATNIVNALYTRLQARVAVRAGQRQVTAGFLNPASSLGPIRLQNFLYTPIVATDHLGLPHVEYMTVSGPFNAGEPGDTPSRQRVFACRPARPRKNGLRHDDSLEAGAARLSAAGDGLGHVGLLRFYDEGRRQERQRLSKPASRWPCGRCWRVRSFVFRAERDPAGVATGRAYTLSDLELASRLVVLHLEQYSGRRTARGRGSGRLAIPKPWRGKSNA
jgi:hypothetical protein